ncbi:MAG: TetR family transcriptional regulator [Myxococcota bacterium]
MARARTAEAKLARREQILAAAVELLHDEAYAALTMASVARAAGLAKGTPYLYWRTKEELFLAALQEQYTELFAAIERAVRAAPPTIPAIADALVAEVLARPRVVALIGLVHVGLEQNAPVDAVIAFKRSLVVGGLGVAVALHDHLPWLSLERAARLLVRFHGAIVALRQMADPPAPIRAALEHPDLALLRVEFAADLRELVVDLLIAARVRAESGSDWGG